MAENNSQPGVPDAPITEEIKSAVAQVIERSDGITTLSFLVPGIHRYNFKLDRQGRQAVAKLLEPTVPTYGPGDMPKES